MKRNKKIEVRVTELERIQINRYFKREGIKLSDYIRNHLLELTKDCALDTSNEKDVFEMFKEYLGDDKVAKDIFTRFAKSSLEDEYFDDEEEYDNNMVFYNGKKITYEELQQIEAEYRKQNG